eukprot:14402887-Heterocapsa_arctica.AAC.1
MTKRRKRIRVNDHKSNLFSMETGRMIQRGAATASTPSTRCSRTDNNMVQGCFGNGELLVQQVNWSYGALV